MALVIIATSAAASPAWTWQAGSKITAQNSVYGALGVASASNAPGGRSGAAATYDIAGKKAYLFGGNGYPESGSTRSYLNDLWSYDTNTGHWTWHSGSKVIDQNGVHFEN